VVEAAAAGDADLVPLAASAAAAAEARAALAARQAGALDAAAAELLGSAEIVRCAPAGACVLQSGHVCDDEAQQGLGGCGRCQTARSACRFRAACAMGMPWCLAAGVGQHALPGPAWA